MLLHRQPALLDRHLRPEGMVSLQQPSAGTERELFVDAANRGARYLEGIRSRSAVPEPESMAPLRALGGPLPARGADAAEIEAQLDGLGSRATDAQARG